jgi:hypothetical protein
MLNRLRMQGSGVALLALRRMFISATVTRNLGGMTAQGIWRLQGGLWIKD